MKSARLAAWLHQRTDGWIDEWREVWRDVRTFAVAVPGRVFEDRLTQSAGSLTYTTLLSIVPLLTIALSLSTAFPAFDRFVGGLQDYIVENYLPDAGLAGFVDQLRDFANAAGRLTAIGLGALTVTGVMMMMTIDDTLNRIFRVERRRPVLQRLLMYWAVLTLGPLLIGAALSMTTALVVHSFGVLDLDEVAENILAMLPFLLTWAALVALYVLVPNRKVKLRDALLGAFLASIAFEIAKRGFALYVSRFPTYRLIYGAFSAMLITLVWMYLSWLVVLAGATFTAMLTEKKKILNREGEARA
jgi:membrane protein